MLRLRGAGALPDAPGLRLVQVGTATLRSSQLFGDFLAPTDNALEDREVAPALQQGARYHRPAPAPLVVAEGIDALTRRACDGEHVSELRLGLARSRRGSRGCGRSTASSGGASALALPSPRSRTATACRRPRRSCSATERAATVAGRRLLLVGGEAAALLFAFAVLAARSMRRDLEAARRRLTWYGARRWHLRLLTVTESAMVAVVGTVAGWLVGILVGALAASAAGAPAGAVLRESVLAPAGIALALAVVIAATVVVAIATSIPARDESRFGPLDIAALAALGLVAAALLGGAADQSRLDDSEGAGLILLAPARV